MCKFESAYTTPFLFAGNTCHGGFVQYPEAHSKYYRFVIRPTSSRQNRLSIVPANAT